MLKTLILNGLGIGYISKKFVERELNNGSLILIEKFKNTPLDNITIIYNLTQENKNVVNFINCLKSNIRKSDN